MPELPDVELFKKYFDKHALHKKIDHVEVADTKILDHTSEKELNNTLSSVKFTSSERHGKYFFIKIDKSSGLSMHFGMTGEIQYLKEKEENPKSTRAIFYFTNKHRLAYIDHRKIGRIGLAGSMEEVIEKHKLGKDALEISFQEFKKVLEKKKKQIKPLLMDQSLIAGIGNVYADEILFQARIHPETKIDNISDAELKEIFRHIKPVLKTGIKYSGKRKDFPKSYIIPVRKKGSECPRKNGRIEMITVGGRTTYFCPACQKEKK
jgi:formamidopyrimidine-DNA glycosylase